MVESATLRALGSPRRSAVRGGAVSGRVVVLTLAVFACDPESPAAPEAAVASVTVAPVLDTLWFGERAQFTATVRDAAGRVLTERTVTWSSSDSAVATVTALGLVMAVGAGAATITAAAEGITGASSITVTPLVFASLSAGDLHTCALTPDGAAYCWGANVLGQLGNGGTSQENAPSAVMGGLRFQSLSARGLHTCAMTTDGIAYCWGFNGYGQLGDGGTDQGNVPGAVAGGLRFRSLSAGGWHTCGLATDGNAYCWGWNSSGQLGDGGTADATTPTALAGGLSFQTLSAGRSHTCGAATDGRAYCWGAGQSGQLGDGTTTGSSAPRPLSGGLALQQVSSGRAHTCGLTTDGTAYCWGSNGAGQVGAGSPGSVVLAPALVAGGLVWASVSAGGDHTCGVTTAGVAYCWGVNDGGQLGTGWADRLEHAVPEAVSGGLAFRQVSAGLFHTCGLTLDVAAYCWGWNDSGQLGINDTSDRRTTPVLVFAQR